MRQDKWERIRDQFTWPVRILVWICMGRWKTIKQTIYFLINLNALMILIFLICLCTNNINDKQPSHSAHTQNPKGFYFFTWQSRGGQKHTILSPSQSVHTHMVNFTPIQVRVHLLLELKYQSSLKILPYLKVLFSFLFGVTIRIIVRLLTINIFLNLS